MSKIDEIDRQTRFAEEQDDAWVAQQLALDPEFKPLESKAFFSHEEKPAKNLRDYQQAAVEAAFKEWEEVSSTLIVLPTGAGKTLVAAEIIKRFLPQRTLFLVHRSELAYQSQGAISHHAEVGASIEMAEQVASTHAWFRAPVVVATVQTLISGVERRRMERFKPEDFGLLVVDEVHHGTAASYRMVIDHFRQNPDLKVLGLTATPDRADEEALGQICETVAYDFEITNAINDGWLVPIEATFISVQGLDYSHVRTTAGDLNGADLAVILEAEKNVQGMVGSAIEMIGNRRTIVFTATVRQAEMACEIFNRHREGMATWISGKTPRADRKVRFDGFREGIFQVLCNVGIVTEGVDVPEAEVCVMAAPTKSRCKYAQQAGRILRPLSGLVDCFDTADERKAAIAGSAKPVASLIDYAGNSGRHVLASAADILGGNRSEEVVALATRKARESGRPQRMDTLLDEAEEEIAEAKRQKELAEQKERERLAFLRKKRIVATVDFTKKSVSPFDVWDITPVRERGWDSGKHLSEKQRAVLVKVGMDPDAMPFAQARQILNETFRRWNQNLCTFKQAKLLKRHGYETKEMTMTEASKAIDALAKNGWKRPMEAA